MKDLEKLKLPKGYEVNVSWAMQESNKAYTYFLPLAEKKVTYCIADRLGDWERVCFLAPKENALSYAELSDAKGHFWEEDEIVMKIYPSSITIRNVKTHQLYRSKDVTKRAENYLKARIKMMYEQAKVYYQPDTTKAMVADNGKVLIIFGGEDWASFKEIERLKEKYWGKEKSVVQFFVSQALDLNPEHIVMLWDAENFELPEI